MNKYKSFRKLILLIILFLFVITLTFVISYSSTIRKPLKSTEDSIIIEVKQGEGFYDILDKLDKENKLTNKLLIKVNLAIDKRKVNLTEGIYEINTNSSLEELIKSLENKDGDKDLVKLTIPEGYSIEDIAKSVEDKGICSKDEFIKDVKDYKLPSFVKNNNKKRYNLEGYLYPDTYLIEKGSNANDVIKSMLDRFEDVLKQAEDETKVEISDEDVEKIVTIASMIEREARVPGDRPLISSVIYNRLEKDMKLQIDAAVIYALGYHVDVVLNKHLEVDSPYNVYKYKGLPVGPIANPGLDCIKAALLPEKTDYLYYIMKDDGSHYFTNNYEDFLNKKKELGY
ncbi:MULTISPECIES: endolytic transglycosylase MltG [Clostridium]|jgi:Predicted periplasmic solute-binding protein|uniref:Endolytic murein transglycosylase n=2 Tax=Clostridium beijerinckii TaxID=1520 RepID=A0AAE2V079_CLOBE|nr:MULTISPECIES: endolytic transglycosylase MltG [Clostridium]ABR33293.1 aminodeoxychorismate lyase [Clostridium beijerinckii NCIMB 8052]AIU01790.1 aminodeoxychorismate lyase [Clostridium beijerinckii ATCC 35702]MBC2458690.1 endolytic transglycosylase MltG [Clostridium beijerinckii]MBC2476151.1 endolytic transglycosylase MltG [Clostridium beijerinckii]MBE6088681.1 endolytic transglycosylase MltG [Clostridium beijerinckii]